MHRTMIKIRNMFAKAQAKRTIPPDPLDCMKPPTYGHSLPRKIGAGGWPVEEPTQKELEHFLKLLKKVPLTYFGHHPVESPDYGTEYSDVIKVKQWLKLLVDEKLLEQK